MAIVKRFPADVAVGKTVECVLASDYDRLVEMCKRLQRVGNCLDIKHPHSNAMALARWDLIRNDLLALIGEGGEQSK